jgi:diaminohydroxyphosphoribosylaminopyrimidine deaminase/5-amino-6-(5-phosphoribosylamino)uracil reductase
MAIAVGSETARIDNPLLTVRHIDMFMPHELPAKNPVRVVIGEGARLPTELALFEAPGETILFSKNASFAKKRKARVTVCLVKSNAPLIPQICIALYEHSVLSILVEGGAHTLRQLLDTELWDEARVFTAPIRFNGGTPAPSLAYKPRTVLQSGVDSLCIYHHPELPMRLGLRE